MVTAPRANTLFLGGLLLTGAGVAHALGWAQFDGKLTSVDPDTLSGLHAGWLWGSLTFAALGTVTMLAARRWRSGVDPRATVLPGAAALLVFGAVGFVARGFDPHYLGFVGFAALIGLPVLSGSPAPSGVQQDPAERR